MKGKTTLLMLFVILAVFTFSFASVSAQDIDLSDMDNAQLIALLQAIMQQLEAEEPAETAEPFPVGTEVPVISVARFSDGKLFKIYENKKLIIERIPDDRFIQKNDGHDTDNKKDTGTPTPGAPTPDPHGCNPGCSWACWTNIFGRPECGCACG